MIVALHGTSIHIGLEVALACHHRVAARAARFGVFAGKLGLLPARAAPSGCRAWWA